MSENTRDQFTGTCCSDKCQRQNHMQYTQGEHVAGYCNRGMCQGQNHARKHEGLFYRDMLQRQVPTTKSYAIHTNETCSRGVILGTIPKCVHPQGNVAGTCPRVMLPRHVLSCEMTVHSRFMLYCFNSV